MSDESATENMVRMPDFLSPVPEDAATRQVLKYLEVLAILKAWKRPVEFTELIAPTSMEPTALMTCLMFLVAQGRVLYETFEEPVMDLESGLPLMQIKKVHFTWFCDDVRKEIEAPSDVDQAIEALKHDAIMTQVEIKKRIKNF